MGPDRTPRPPPSTTPTGDGDPLLAVTGPMHRRRALVVLGGGLLALAGCASSDSGGTEAASSSTSTTAGGTSSSTSTSTAAATVTECSALPEETAGPYPGDGSNGPDVLSMDGVVRRDIRPSLTGSSIAEGVPLEIELVVVDVADGCTPREGLAVYAWHCDAEGQYSMYGQGVSDETFCRGVQAADAGGVARFTSIFPGCYPGRWPHVHLEVFESVEAATGGGEPLVTSQLAFPDADCQAAYATSGYEASAGTLSRTSLESDMVFRDSWEEELATMSGDVDGGYTARLTVGV